jgi:hypothetical protein
MISSFQRHTDHGRDAVFVEKGIHDSGNFEKIIFDHLRRTQTDGTIGEVQSFGDDFIGGSAIFLEFGDYFFIYVIRCIFAFFHFSRPRNFSFYWYLFEGTIECAFLPILERICQEKIFREL